jgi:tetratricopeptide (TPR) repeat protein
MRRVHGWRWVVGSVVVVLGAIGVAGRLADWDTPGATRAPVAKPRADDGPRTRDFTAREAAPIVAAPGSRLEARRLLLAGEYEKLGRLMESKQVAAAADVRREPELTRLVLAFDVSDEATGARLDAWVAADPKGWAPHLARAEHYVSVAFTRRGTQWGKETSAKQKSGFQDYLRKATIEAEAALAANPKSIEAYGLLIRIGMARADQNACLAVADRALAIEPNSARIRFSLIYCLRPRWGGSYSAIEAIAEEARGRVDANPSLAALGGMVPWDQGTLLDEDEAEEAIVLFSEALQSGEYYEFYADRARELKRRKRHSDALADLANALALRPEDPDILAIRVRTFTALGRYDNALADVRMIRELDPENSDLAWIRNHETKNTVSRVEELLERNDVTGALERVHYGIGVVGESAPLLFWRGRAYMQRKQYDRALTDMRAAVRLDPRDIEAYHNVDWLLAREGRWDEIICHWTDYLKLEPQSGEGFLERAGAHRHKGDKDAFLADAREACHLGVQKGCAAAPTTRQ